MVIFLFLCTGTAKAQLFYPTFYPEKELLASFQHANTPAEQINASGVLALHYKTKFQDSLSNVYMGLVYNIAGKTNDQQLLAKALWWDAQVWACGAYDETKQAIAKANSLLQFAFKNKLYPEAITAKLLLVDINIYKGLKLSEQNAADAYRLLQEWKINSTGRTR